jgi:hypothetical protein
MRNNQNGGTGITHDNTGSVTWANGTAKFARSKHVGFKMHHVQNQVESKQIVIQQVGTKEMLADIMMFSLDGPEWLVKPGASPPPAPSF